MKLYFILCNDTAEMKFSPQENDIESPKETFLECPVD